MISYVFLLIGLILGFIIMNIYSMVKQTSSLEDKGEELYSWVSPNKLWISTKFSIVCLGIVIILPSYITLKSDNLITMEKGFRHFLNTINNTQAIIKPLNSWTNLEIILSIIYICFLIFIVNITIRYHITTNGIFYSIFGIGPINFNAWSEIVCFNSDDNHLKIWFRPPCFKPNWIIEVPTKDINKISTIFSKFVMHYSIAKNKIK